MKKELTKILREAQDPQGFKPFGGNTNPEILRLQKDCNNLISRLRTENDSTTRNQLCNNLMTSMSNLQNAYTLLLRR